MFKALVSAAAICIIAATGYYGYSEYSRYQKQKAEEERIKQASFDRTVRYIEHCTDVLNDKNLRTSSARREYNECLEFAKQLKASK